MASALALHLDSLLPGWRAAYAGLDEINFTNADGEKFVICVVRVDDFDDALAGEPTISAGV